MEPAAHGRHIAEALRWSPHTPRSAWQGVAAGLGMAAPLALGFAIDNAGAGFAGAVGGLMMGAVPTERTLGRQLRDLALAIAPASFALAITMAIPGPGALERILVVVLCAIAALAGGLGRSMAVATYRFVLFLLIAVSVAGNVAHRGELLAPIALGIAWGALANIVFGSIARALHPAEVAEAEPVQPAPTLARRIAHWRGTLRHLAGWQYALRLAACLALAQALDVLWPGHRLHWIALTVALVMERGVEALPIRGTQRAAGTLLGVLVAGIFFGVALPAGALVAVVGVLAAARAILRTRNYLAYTVVTTPLILAILDAGEPPGMALLVERVLATLVGAGLVIAANGAIRRLGHPPAPAR
ncbi:MAG TPA: FUSC family protein [Usitatibacter sp.]|nr:FUSC family protein [Usitatibacter sp.]